MWQRCVWRFAPPILALGGWLLGNAQEQQGIEVQGSVHAGRQFAGYRYLVELSDLRSRGRTWRADVAIDGSFRLHNVPPGEYTARLMTFEGGVIEERSVCVREPMSPVELTLPSEDRPGGTVSVRQLQNPPAHKAVRAAAAAQRFAEEGNGERAVEELRKAIRISPDYAAAHANLAVEYIRRHNWEEARAEIERALAIAGPDALALSNLAFLDVVEGRYAEGVETARAALRADPASVNAHFILGTLLLRDPQTFSEGVEHLEKAAEKSPGARALLDRVRPARR